MSQNNANQLATESVQLMEGLTALPFNLADTYLRQSSTETGRIIKEGNSLARSLALMPFELALNILNANPPSPDGEQNQ